MSITVKDIKKIAEEHCEIRVLQFGVQLATSFVHEDAIRCLFSAALPLVQGGIL
jgi:hypothetical protein